jgi:hypothetical protein
MTAASKEMLERSNRQLSDALIREMAKNKELLDLLAHAVEQDGYGMCAPLFHQAKELLREAGIEVTS